MLGLDPPESVVAVLDFKTNIRKKKMCSKVTSRMKLMLEHQWMCMDVTKSTR